MILFTDSTSMKIASDECILPCNVTTYEASLSYAQLSSVNIDRLVLSHSEKKSLVLTKFHHALETLQHADLSIAKHDQKSINDIIKFTHALQSELIKGVDLIRGRSALYKLVKRGMTWLVDAQNKTEKLVQTVTNLADMNKGYLKHSLKDCFLDRVLGIFGHIAEEIPAWFDKMNECVEVGNISLPAYSNEITSSMKELFLECVHWEQENKKTQKVMLQDMSCTQALQYYLELLSEAHQYGILLQ